MGDLQGGCPVCGVGRGFWCLANCTNAVRRTDCRNVCPLPSSVEIRCVRPVGHPGEHSTFVFGAYIAWSTGS